MTSELSGTPFPLVPDDGGREDAGFVGVTNMDCVTRSIAIATGRPYDQVLGMVNEANGELGGPAGNAADTGAYGLVTAKLMYELGWPEVPIRNGARLTLEDLQGPLDEYEVLVVETQFPTQVTPEKTELTFHLTAIIDGVVHDLETMGDNGCAHIHHRVVTVWGRP